MQVVANFSFGDSMARFSADVDDMKKAAAGRMESDIMHMALPNQGRVSSCTCLHIVCPSIPRCIFICFIYWVKISMRILQHSL